MKCTPQKTIVSASARGRLLGEPERVADVVGDVLDLGQLVVVGEDHRVALGGERPHLVLQGGDVLEHQRRVGRAEHRQVHGSGSRIRERSSAGALWVSAPTEMNCTPVLATSRSVSSVTPPLASSSARPATRRHRRAQLRRRSCCRAGSAARRPPAPRRPRSSVAALDLERQLRGARPRPPHRLAHPAGERGVVLLDQDRVVEPGAVVGRRRRRRPRPSPAPAARASSCACRGSGRRCPRRRATQRAASVATPDSRCRKFSAVRSAGEERPRRARRPEHRAPVAPHALRGQPARLDASGSSARNVASAASRPKTTPGAFWVIVARARASATVAAVVTSPAPTSSARARATVSSNGLTVIGGAG